MRLRLLLLVLLLSACAQPNQQLEANLTAAQMRSAALDAQVAALQANLTDVQQQLGACTLGRDRALENLTDAQRRLAFEILQRSQFEHFYEQGIEENTMMNQSLQSCLRKLAPTSVSTGGYRTIPYDDLMRNADLYVGSKVTYTGEVVQVSQGDDGTFVLRVDITDKKYYWTDTVWVEYVGQRVLEKDLIRFSGTFNGLTTYRAVLGQDVTLPKIAADSVAVSVKAADR